MEMIDLKCENCGGTMQPDENGLYAICEYCGARQEIEKKQNALTDPIVITTESKGTKSKTAAGLLAIFLGTFGAHNFYLGYTTKAIIQLVLSVVFCWTYVVPMAIWFWSMFEAIRILTGHVTDATGNQLS